jgi:hypothetical protein
MDDWSLLPSRNVSDPAPNPQSTMTTTEDVLSDSPGRVKRPQPAPITRARKTRPLTRPASPNNKTTKSGTSPETPAKDAKPIMTLSKLSTDPSANFKNGQPSLDITRPFMDDIGATSVIRLGSVACSAASLGDEESGAMPDSKHADGSA